jgi:hypothetical protein
MRKAMGLAAVLGIAIAATAGRGRAEEPAPSAGGTVKEATLADLAWLAGRWRSQDGGEVFDETWLPAEGDAMAAVSRSVEGGKTGLYELSAIERTDAGLVLRIRHFGPGVAPWASESGETPSWPLARRGAREATFEEPSRAFPRRIVYRREKGAGADVLVARLEGERGGKPATMEFRLARVGD